MCVRENSGRLNLTLRTRNAWLLSWRDKWSSNSCQTFRIARRLLIVYHWLFASWFSYRKRDNADVEDCCIKWLCPLRVRYSESLLITTIVDCRFHRHVWRSKHPLAEFGKTKTNRDASALSSIEWLLKCSIGILEHERIPETTLELLTARWRRTVKCRCSRHCVKSLRTIVVLEI